jgi:hypothetical protein
VWGQGYKLLQTQLYFENDPTVDFDFRAELASQTFGATEKAFRFHFSPCAGEEDKLCATMDFVLARAPLGSKEASYKTLEVAAFHANCDANWDPGQPWPLCHPWAIPFVRADLISVIFVLIVFALLAAIGAIGTCCVRKCFGASRAHQKPQRVGQPKSKAE